ncbi:helix-turn-helix domain-containing protein [Streptomyces sp. NBC_01176]|uniref:helix-turn-helix domain-containing protein n=1 Tax=Streptomyces sp. NBC_01176 TaxID=2903760 RepID=UPI00386C32D7|nr:PucR family transcriptional regulator [Streptomyces sp. NBC_01176]
MHVEHLLQDESLGLRLLWADDPLLRQEISGVTATDLEDPARFVRRGEAVLSGLVWWSPEDGQGRAERFVAALKTAGAAVLLAGEETHGSVPDDLVEACARHGVPVAAVPVHIMFRAITDTVYLRQWGELSRHHALPETVRVRLSRLVAQDAGPDLILATALAHLGRSTAYVFTPAGRTVAATEGAVPVPAHEAVALMSEGPGVTVPVEADAVSPYGRWHLHLPGPDDAPPRMLHEIAAILGRCQESRARRRAAEHQVADELGALLAGADAGAGTAAVEGALRTCGLSAEGPYGVVVAGTGAGREGLAEGALAEAVAHATTGPVAVGRLPDGTAFAVVPAAATAPLKESWPLVAACEPSTPVHGGIGSPAVGPRDLTGALAEARYALGSARTTKPDTSALTDIASLTGLDTLLTGIPADVRTAYSRTVLGPLLDTRNASFAALLQTLETFLACDGSWARTAEAMHLHVNSVHYRIGRIEHFTGRDLSRLYDRLDLRAALLCRTDLPDPATRDRPARSSKARAR